VVSPLATVLGVLLAILLIAGGIVRLRSGLTRSHIPVIMVALLALTSGVVVAAEYHTTQTEIEQIDYRVESQAEGCDTADDDRVSEFNELSPDAQEVFLSALQSNEAYTTTKDPDQFYISSDNGVENYIIYESDCYSLVGYGAGLGAGWYLLVLLLFGVPFTFVLAVLAVYSYRIGSFRIPATVVSAVSVGAVLRPVANSVFAIAVTIGLLIVGLVWIIAGGFNPLKASDR
jgi:hypothetical protein